MQENQLIQNYRLVRLLGEGGMGEVWLGKHLYLEGREAAIKGIHSHLSRSDAVRGRLKKEALVLSSLQHPAIVGLIDYLELDSGSYLVMERVIGRRLDQYVAEDFGPLPYDRLMALFSEILRGFGYAHSCGVVHRDVKPGNFMVTNDHRIKVLDFGIAKVLDGQDAGTKTGTLLGTTKWMSPEQVQGRPVTHRSDIYSLGVLLFFMATGRSPYDSHEGEYAVYDAIVRNPLPSVNSSYPAAPRGLDMVIAKATAKDPGVRYENCDAFLSALASVPPPDLENDDTSETAVRREDKKSFNVTARPAGNRVRQVAWTTAGVVVLGLIGLVIFQSSEMSLKEARRRFSIRDFDAAYSGFVANSEDDEFLPKDATRLGLMYAQAYGTARDFEKAKHWFGVAIQGGDLTGWYCNGLLLENGEGGFTNIDSAIICFKKAGHEGHLLSQMHLAEYYEAFEAEDSLKECAFWYMKAANNGSPEAMVKIGEKLEIGRGRTQDLTQAAEWYKRAANMDYPRGCTEFGRVLQRGIGISVDLQSAYRWLLKADELGDSLGTVRLSACYERGLGVRQDSEKALDLLEKLLSNSTSPESNLQLMVGLLREDVTAAASPKPMYQDAFDQGNYWGKYLLELYKFRNSGSRVLRTHTDSYAKQLLNYGSAYRLQLQFSGVRYRGLFLHSSTGTCAVARLTYLGNSGRTEIVEQYFRLRQVGRAPAYCGYAPIDPNTDMLAPNYTPDTLFFSGKSDVRAKSGTSEGNGSYWSVTQSLSLTSYGLEVNWNL